MESFSWFKMEPYKFYNDTFELTSSEVGVYTRIIMLIYGTHNKLKDTPSMGNRLNLTEKDLPWSEYKHTLLEGGFIYLDDGFIRNEKCDEVIAGLIKSSKSAQKAAKARWDKQPTDNIEENATALRPNKSPHMQTRQDKTRIDKNRQDKTRAEAREEDAVCVVKDVLEKERLIEATAGCLKIAAEDKTEPIQELMDKGYSFENEILPAIRAAARTKGKGEISTLKYFIPAIQAFRSENNTEPSKPLDVSAIKDDAWHRTVKFYRQWVDMTEEGLHPQDWMKWNTSLGPRPGEKGCKAPKKILEQFKFGEKPE